MSARPPVVESPPQKTLEAPRPAFPGVSLTPRQADGQARCPSFSSCSFPCSGHCYAPRAARAARARFEVGGRRRPRGIGSAPPKALHFGRSRSSTTSGAEMHPAPEFR
jgi:hypothetical protein